MNKILIPILALCATSVFAADSLKTTTITSRGTVTEYRPGETFVVKEGSGPVTYRFGKATTYVTKSGKTLSDDEVKTRVKEGTNVSVHYSNDGDTRIIERVEVDED